MSMCKLAVMSISLTIVAAVSAPLLAVTLPSPSVQDTATPVARGHPPNCLYLWPHSVVLGGRLSGVEYPPDPGETPPTPARAVLFLRLAHPISTCAVPSMFTDAYVNVTEVAIESISVTEYRSVIRKWGKDQILVEGKLGNSGWSSWSPLAVTINMKKFCYGNGTVFHCLSGNAMP